KHATVPGLTRTSGGIGLQQNQKSDVEFRNIRIKKLPRLGTEAPPGKAEGPSIVGRWLNDREDASTHEFLPDGRYRYVHQGRTSEGKWSQQGDQVSFEWTDATTKESNKRSLRIESAQGNTITVLVDGKRSYTWKKLD